MVFIFAIGKNKNDLCYTHNMNGIDTKNDLIIFTDGSSLGNPGPGGWGAMMVFEKLDELVELGGSKARTTNNEMELTAIVSALTYSLHNTEKIHIFTDSQYAINGITKWVHGWAKNGWKTKTGDEIKNKFTWQTLHSLMSERPKGTVLFHHVSGHVGVPGNERVDDIARELGEGKQVDLYRGKYSNYGISGVLDIEKIFAATAQKKSLGSKSSKGAKAYSYLSLIGGELQKHGTWTECESRVKGKKAKFKKALSVEHEKEILKEWGVE